MPAVSPGRPGGVLVQQLSGMDASFLYGETPRAHMAGGGVVDLRPVDRARRAGSRSRGSSTTSSSGSTRPGSSASGWCGCRSTSTTRTGSRIPTSTSSSTSATSPCPQPGDWRQLCIQVARLVSRPLDLDRPLWELYVIEGLDNVEGVPKGSFALVTKVHHAAIDGMSGMEMTSAIHDDAPTPSRHRPTQPGGPRRSRAPPSCWAGRRQQRRPPDARRPGSSGAPCPSSAGCSARSSAARSRRRRRRSRAPAGAARSPPTACSTPSGSELDDLRAHQGDGPGRDDQRRRADDRRRRAAQVPARPRASCPPTR